MKFGYSNIVLILILLIIMVVVLQLVFAKMVVEGADLESTRTKYTDSNYGGIESRPVPSDPARWSELDNMKQICAATGYNVTDWNAHIHLLANEIGVPFNVKRGLNEQWSTYGYTSSYWTSRRVPYTIGWGKWRKTFWFTLYNRVYKRHKYTEYLNYNSQDEFRFVDYGDLISELVSNGIKNDSDLNKTNTFNASGNGFTTMEGFAGFGGTLMDNVNIPEQMRGKSLIETMDSPVQLVDDPDKLKLANGKLSVNQNIIDTIKSTGYKVESVELSEFIKKFISTGKTLVDMRRYINAMQKFGINDETAAKEFLQYIYEKLNPKNNKYVDIETLINTYFPKYGLMSVTDFVDKHADGLFYKGITSKGLHALNGIPLFPTTSNTTNCVMEKMSLLSGVNIPTMGIDQKTQTHNVCVFFDEFGYNNVSAQEFFNSIYDTYSNLNIKSSSYDIKYTLQFCIGSIYPNSLIQAFKELTQILNSSNLNMSFNDYTRLIDILKRRVSFNRNDIVKIWSRFKTYYSMDNSNANITPDTLDKWFNDIEKFYSQNSPLISESSTFFTTTGGGDFLYFIQSVLIDGSYKMSDIQRDIKLGLSYTKLISTYSNLTPNKQTPSESKIISGFDIISPDQDQDQEQDPLTYLYAFLLNGFRQIFGSNINEGFDEKKISQSDVSTLNSFGITILSDGKLKNLENQLMDAGIDKIDTAKTPWNNIMTFVGAMVKIQITTSNFQEFVDLMKKFRANTIKDWQEVLNRLVSINIKNYSSVEIFITQITSFGIHYDSNFYLFLDKLNDFSANFAASGLDPLVTFLGDMKTVGVTYDTPEGIQTVNNIIDFFANNRISLYMYDPSHFFHKFVMALHEYKNGNYPNKLYDIQTPALFNVVSLRERITAIEEAYMICKNINSYRNMQPVIVPNMILIISFVYKEELDAIVNGNDGYSDINKRVSMMHDIGEAMMKWANEFKDDASQQSTVKLYIAMSSVIKTFPALTFQCISEDILSKCGNGNCIYNQYVDCAYTYCKACTTTRTTNYRTKPPVL